MAAMVEDITPAITTELFMNSSDANKPMDYSKFFKLGKPTCYIVTMDESPFADLYLQLTAGYPKAVIRMIRGKKCRTVPDFFDEIAAALQFPYYFGENWNAFAECIADLDWIEGDAYLLMVSDASLLLSEADTEDFSILMQTLSRANEEWLTPNQYIPRNRPSTSFHVVFQCFASDVSSFIQRMGSVSTDSEKL